MDFEELLEVGVDEYFARLREEWLLLNETH